MSFDKKAWQKANMPAWRAKNRERLTAYDAAYYAKNKEAYKSHNQNWRKANEAKNRERMRKYLIANRDRINKNQIIRYGRNPFYAIAKSANRRAIKRSVDVGVLRVISEWEKLWRSKPTSVCYWCQSRVSSRKCAADHIIPIRLGGPHSIENMCISCLWCNSSKKAKPLAEWVGKISQPTFLI